MNLEELWSAEDEQTGCKVVCEYDTSTMIFIVTVSKNELQKIEYFPASFDASAGIDVADLTKAQEIAVRLADSFEV